jgi:16S rRNA (guanine966-N2)-methyltransferase
VNQCVRIIGGQYRGKKISFPEIEGLRPTPDRVKETLFNWLMNEIRGARCIDAFAGSGSLGFEALSRNASQVVMIESSPKAFKSLTQAALAFNRPELKVINVDALSYLRNTKEPFDIIFLDPPFKENYFEECLDIISTGSSLAQGGLLYVESPVEMSLDEEIWSLRKSKKAGQVFYALFERR